MTKTRVQRVIISALLCLVLCLGMFTPFLIPVSAAETTYSNVLEDLEKDENFNPADFPENPTDYSLQVITVAEGENGELFVYVYQPSNATKDLRASKINMSHCSADKRKQTAHRSRPQPRLLLARNNP